ncbi:MAG: response regulator [Merismopedia sp. SIO2A8]|nr:response regulator [Merismopedia sp. SIO2A8]
MAYQQQAYPARQAPIFMDSKKIQLLQALKRCQFSGQLLWTAPDQKQWIFYLYQGNIRYATGGIHPVRRWQRNLLAYCPRIYSQLSEILSKLQRMESGINPVAKNESWEYQVLYRWVEQGKITREQAVYIIQAAITEVLLDVLPAKDATHQLKSQPLIPKLLILIDVEQAITEVKLLLQNWSKAKVDLHIVNRAPVIKEPERLKQNTSVDVYNILKTLLNGRRTLRDLAVQMRQDVVQITRSLLPYIESGIVELVTIPDLPNPFPQTSIIEQPISAELAEPLIACVDDSLLVCQTMKQLLTKTAYQFVGVNEPLRAIAILLNRRPNFIFLDLVMPNANGYEICTQLRKLSCFQNTPIVMLTGLDGIVDQVRARLAGASDFVTKPIDAEKILRVINRHLESE